MAHGILKLQILLGRLDDYAAKLNAALTPTRRERASAEAVRRDIATALKKMENDLPAEVIRDIREGVERIVQGSNSAAVILKALKAKLTQAEKYQLALKRKAAAL